MLRAAQLNGSPCRTGSMAEPREIVDRLLAAYPHAATCPACRGYAAMIIKDHSSALAVAAVLGRHDAHHRVDPLALASGRFRPRTRRPSPVRTRRISARRARSRRRP